MTSYVALLRGVNLGKRQLRMADLRQIGVKLGYEQPRTYIASGNLLFSSGKSEKALKAELEEGLATHMNAAVGVMIRHSEEIADVVRSNPFADQPGNRVVAIFLDEAPGKDALDDAKNVADERMALGRREIYVHYPSGQGRSKLAIPAAKNGTARNMNSVARLADLAKETE